MNLFEIILFNSTFLIYPILFYIIYILFSKTLDRKENDLFFDFALISSFYLLVKFGIMEYKHIDLLFLDIILLIAYLTRKKRSIFIINTLLIIYYFDTGDINIYFLLGEYLFYFILYLFCQKKKRVSYVNIFLFFRVIIFYHICFINNGFKINDYRNYLIIIISLFVIAKLTTIIFKRAIDICSLYKTVENMENDKNTKESLFKITHEIKNPIAVVKGYLDMFNVDNPEHSKKYIPIIKEEINRVLILLEDFLCITKIRVVKEEMDLGLLFEEIDNSFKLMLNNKNIVFEYEKADEVYINADYNRLKQVFVNLLKNSMESISKKGKIVLKYSLLKDKIKIILIDNGKGMDKNDLESLKKAFFTTKKNGTGLGIYLSNEIILKHGGHMKYESEKNKGTRVTITLPCK